MIRIMRVIGGSYMILMALIFTLWENARNIAEKRAEQKGEA